MSAAICQLRGCRCVLRIEVVRGGATKTTCDWCERKHAGLCRDCPKPVYGRVGWAIRCETCAKRRRLDQGALFRDDDDVRRRIAARDRKRYRTDQAYRQRRCAQRRDWAVRNPEKKKRAARRLLVSEGPSRERYLATQRRHNADPRRAAEKRARALAKYYELHPTRPNPRCTGCDERITWGGIGKPAKWCDGCCPPAELRRRQKLGRSITVIRDEAVA